MWQHQRIGKAKLHHVNNTIFAIEKQKTFDHQSQFNNSLSLSYSNLSLIYIVNSVWISQIYFQFIFHCVRLKVHLFILKLLLSANWRNKLVAAEEFKPTLPKELKNWMKIKLIPDYIWNKLNIMLKTNVLFGL